MKYLKGVKHLIISVIALLFISNCSERSSQDKEDQEYSNAQENGFHNGTFCADVEYYYSKTGTNSTYVLQVEVENGLLVKIHWPNGGWLDDSHFSPPDIEDGTAEFTSDQGVDYKISITGNGDDCSTSSYVESETDLVNKYNQQQNDQEDERISKQKDDDDEVEQNRLREEEYQAEKKKREEEEKEQEEKDKAQDDDNNN